MNRLILSFVVLACASVVGAAEKLEFNRDIRPILSDKCFSCHGPDAHGRKAKLRLDLRDAAMKDHDGVRAIVPGDAAASEALIRMLSKDPDELMPPAEAEKAMSPKEIATIRQWIAEGAEYQEHWAYVAPERAEPPQVGTKEWADNPVDRFIYGKLQREGMSPAGLADPRTLVRRIHFDLTGLPPTPEVVDAFVANPTQDAWTAMVETLLKSPHYGERMTSYWFDLVRFADTQGYHSDDKQKIFPYRDYIIKAFNDNKPFDQFTTEQLAGDLLPNATEEQRVASGYNRLNQVTGEGGAQPGEYLAKYMADRISTTSEVWMGATLGCAECHDHKYDPFSQKDFYQFGAFFADLQEKGVYSGRARSTGEYPPMMTLSNPVDAEAAKALADELRQLEAQEESLIVEQSSSVKVEPSDWKTIRVAAATSTGASKLEPQGDGSILATGKKSKNENYRVQGDGAIKTVGALRVEILPHPSFKGLSRNNGNIVLSEVAMHMVADADRKNARKVDFAGVEASETRSENWRPEGMIDKNPKSGWAGYADKEKQSAKTLLFRLAKPLTVPDGHHLEVVLKHEADRDYHTTGRFRLAVSQTTTPSMPGVAVDPVLTAALEKPAKERNATETAAVRAYLKSVPSPSLAAVTKKIADVKAKQEKLKTSGPMTMVSVAVEPREVRILPRGDWLDNSGEVVTSAVPHFLPQPEVSDRRLTRLDLARWLTDEKNPLTARVTVNRLWYLFFGQGISNVLNDLGSQGEWPVHPELLDWLSVEFRESGWDVKHVVRLMVHSRAYQLSSVPTPEQLEKDPLNRLHARQARVRLQAEFVRDNALAISGLLVRDVGGDSVMPYQPEGYWSDSYKSVGNPHKYRQDKGEALYRRGMYTFWKRTFLHPSLMAFDAPNRESCEARRPVSNTPLQALALLNDPTYVEAARAFAARALLQQAMPPEARINWIMREAIGRGPDSGEMQVLSTLLEEQRKRYKDAPEAAAALISVGESKVGADVPPIELAAWTAVTRTVLNLHEAITRD